ncbi:MAG: class I SAM-dependent methyltransferase [Planctomycetaceae bacterium]|nr:class I SAM-dependent methyltransferase [Planctomycetaceae bacterium]
MSLLSALPGCMPSFILSSGTPVSGTLALFFMQFAAYSRYYDLLYQDKNYRGETAYIIDLLSRYDNECHTLLELGCGTGIHASLLAEAGFDVTGVEISESMLKQALLRAADVSGRITKGAFNAVQGNALTVRVEQSFDAVVSLFHVVSYQTTNSDVQKMFETASTHLKPGGVFLFDVWYGPAVVHMRPVVRVKRMDNESIRVLRIAEPQLNMNDNRVDVTYTVLITEKATGRVEQLTEEHHMRYYFAPELSLLAQSAGMVITRSEEWMTGNAPSELTWGVTFVARKT